MLIGMQLVEEFITTVILSGHLQNEAPVSTVLIATPECGKTSIVLERPCKAVFPVTDATGRGLMEICKMRGEITHIVLNDLVAIMSHKQTVNQYTLSVINAMTEEGIQAVAFPGSIERYEHGKRGIIACTTVDLFVDKRHWWWKIGLASRLLPFGYDHPTPLQLKIKALIESDNRNGTPAKEIIVPAAKIHVTIPEKHNPEIRKLSDYRSKLLGDPKGYRRLLQYRALAKAHALRRTWKNPVTVTVEDIEFLHRIDAYISYTETKPL